MLGDKIKQLRKNKNINQKEFAEILNIPVSTLANYENNHRQPNIETLKKISKYLDIPIANIIDNTDKSLTIRNNELKIIDKEESVNEYFEKYLFSFLDLLLSDNHKNIKVSQNDIQILKECCEKILISTLEFKFGKIKEK